MSTTIGRNVGLQDAPRPWIAGACAGLAHLSGIRTWIIRTGAVVLLVIHPVLMLLFYGAAALLLRRGVPAGSSWFGGRRWLRRRWFRRRRERAFRGFGPRDPGRPSSPLTELGGRLDALDRRLDALEAAIGEGVHLSDRDH